MLGAQRKGRHRLTATARCNSGGHGTRTRNPLRGTTFPVVTRIAVTPDTSNRYRTAVFRGAASGARTRANLTQIMNLLRLAPDIQEEFLFLNSTLCRRKAVTERDVEH